MLSPMHGRETAMDTQHKAKGKAGAKDGQGKVATASRKVAKAGDVATKRSMRDARAENKDGSADRGDAGGKLKR
mgnify:CR=1 FL=1